jgi:hypothetical protein
MTFGRVSILIGQLSDSNLRIWLSVAICTVLFGLFGYGADATMTALDVAVDVHAALVGAIVGLGAGLGFWLVLAGLRKRRSHLAEELQRVAELNHTVRNSLHVIALAHYAGDEEHRAMVLENTTRIDETLRELFPVVGPSEQQRNDGQNRRLRLGRRR